MIVLNFKSSKIYQTSNQWFVELSPTRINRVTKIKTQLKFMKNNDFKLYDWWAYLNSAFTRQFSNNIDGCKLAEAEVKYTMRHS